MNHTGMPLGYGPFAGKQREVYAQWRTTMPAIAACPNVTMKLGGMMMRLAAYDYNALPAPPTSEQLVAFWRPYIEPCIELFGARRCTFESNFPVDKMGIGWQPALVFLRLSCRPRPTPCAAARTPRRVSHSISPPGRRPAPATRRCR